MCVWVYIRGCSKRRDGVGNRVREVEKRGIEIKKEREIERILRFFFCMFILLFVFGLFFEIGVFVLLDW